MYVPAQFRETRLDVLHGLMRARPLASLITLGASGLEANHVPFFFSPGGDGNGCLLGHVSRQNPLWKDPGADARALTIFHGPSSYISPSFYPGKREHGKVVPTWNYVVVHAHGVLRVHDEPDWIRRQLELLTDHMEASSETPWSVTDAPADYLERLAQGIVGTESGEMARAR
jgi:transcriptional regulator